MVSRQRMQGGAPTWLGSPAPVVVDARPQLVAQLLQRGEQGDPARVEGLEIAVDLEELGQETVALDLSMQAPGRAEGGGRPICEQSGAGVRVGRAIGGRAHRGLLGWTGEGAPKLPMRRVCREGVTPPTRVPLGAESATIRCQAAGEQGRGRRGFR